LNYRGTLEYEVAGIA